MFRNLDAEQARKGMTNRAVAAAIGISRVSYENKKASGKFTTIEAKKMCEIFDCTFEYLFETDSTVTVS